MLNVRKQIKTTKIISSTAFLTIALSSCGASTASKKDTINDKVEMIVNISTKPSHLNLKKLLAKKADQNELDISLEDNTKQSSIFTKTFQYSDISQGNSISSDNKKLIPDNNDEYIIKADKNFYINSANITCNTTSTEINTPFKLKQGANVTKEVNYICTPGTPAPKPTPSAMPDHVIVGYYTKFPDTIEGLSNRQTDSLENTIDQGYNVIDFAFENFKNNSPDSNSITQQTINCSNNTENIQTCLQNLKKNYKKELFLLSIGGANATQDEIIFLTPNTSTTQVTSNITTLHNLIKKYHFDGIDFDMEYKNNLGNLLFQNTNADKFLNFIKKYHENYPGDYLTFAPESPNLYDQKQLYLNIWTYLIQNKSKPWLGWYQVQFYNQDSSIKPTTKCYQNAPFGTESVFLNSCNWGAVTKDYEDYRAASDGKSNNKTHTNFDKHFVIGTPASVFASGSEKNSDFLGSQYDTNNGGAALSPCDQLSINPKTIADNYYNNATKNDHPNILGFMTWDTYNDFDAQNAICSNNRQPKWSKYSWVTEIKQKTQSGFKKLNKTQVKS